MSDVNMVKAYTATCNRPEDDMRMALNVAMEIEDKTGVPVSLMVIDPSGKSITLPLPKKFLMMDLLDFGIRGLNAVGPDFKEAI